VKNQESLTEFLPSACVANFHCMEQVRFAWLDSHRRQQRRRMTDIAGSAEAVFNDCLQL
jgi:hypothetical protein